MSRPTALADALSDAARRDPGGPALITDSESITRAALADRMLDGRERLAREGCGEGQVVAVHGPATAGALVDVLAVSAVGARAALIHPGDPPTEREARVASVSATIELAGGTVRRLERGAERPGPWDVMVFTSGSSGAPKGVMHTWESLFASAAASAANLGWQQDDRWLLDLPIAHVGGLGVVVRCLLGARPIVLSEAPFTEAVERHGVTLASLVPTQLQRVVRSDGEAPACLRAVLVGGAAARPALVAEARRAGYPVLLTWGMSEAGSQIATQPLSAARSLDPVDLSTVGAPLPGFELRIRDGLAEVRGPSSTLGYHPPELHGSPVVDGWLRTGDRVEWDGERLRVLGRETDLLISGGENVSPSRVAAVLCEHPAVDDAYVVGVPHEEWGEAVGALLVGRPVPDRELARWCRARLAPWQRPARVAWVLSIPLGPTGKPDRHAALQLLLGAG